MNGLYSRSARTVRKRWARVRVEANTCWTWTGAVHTAGYGSINAASGLAHRWAYEAVKGPIPTGLHLDHLCRNRACVNPDHLEPVTARVNILRGPTSATAVNARKTSCKHGHAFDVANTYYRVDAAGRTARRCRRCHSLDERERRAAA